MLTKLTEIKGVGEKTGELLASAGLETVEKLINFLPRKHEDFSEVVEIADLVPGKVTIRAHCEKISTRIVRRGLRITTAALEDDSGKVQAVWFNQPYRETQLKNGADFFISGEFAFRSGRYQLTAPGVEAVKDLPVQTGRILPIYPARKGLKPNITRKILNELRPLITMLPETLPPDIIKNEKLLSRADALSSLHFPKNPAQVEIARQRLAFEELFGLILAARLNEKANSALNGYRIKFNQSKIKQLVMDLPFTLTVAQKRALWDILQDFEKKQPMNRLLQGDVGSGKTVVAGAAAYQAAISGFQTAIMAPTEILAIQHAETLRKLLESYGINVALLTGSVKGKAREELLKRITSGEAQVVVGTHALFQKTVEFHKLGFVIIDEQHRFGVKQRQELLSKGTKMPHLIAMTATPIPRSLQLTLFGDLDISILDQLPKGRKPIKTEIISPNSRAQMNEKICAELDKKHQVYFIAPLIEESENAERESVEKLAQKVKCDFKNAEVGTLHGKMKSDEKEKIMREFANDKIQILVATTVVEVGVDVPNATVIVIENADQFGLSQLHQLRGRVGRNEHRSLAFLVQSDSSAPTRRLREIERSNDGFYLAEVDLQLRGAGEIYGTAQHGELNLQIANLADTKLIKRASMRAEQFSSKIIENPEILSKYPELKKEISKYQRLTTLN